MKDLDAIWAGMVKPRIPIHQYNKWVPHANLRWCQEILLSEKIHCGGHIYSLIPLIVKPWQKSVHVCSDFGMETKVFISHYLSE